MRRIVPVLTLVFLTAAAARAQAPRPDNTRDVLLANWNEIGEKS